MRLAALALLLPLAAARPEATPTAATPSAPPATEFVNPGPCDPAANPQCHAITVGGVRRTYVLHVPANLAPGAALVIAIHGGGGSGEAIEKDSGLNQTADEKGFAVVYPDGTLNIAKPPGLGWKIFYSEAWWKPGQAPDDEAYYRQLIAHLQDTLKTDPARVYVTGFSFGGYMTNRVAVDLSDVVAAGGIVDGCFGWFLTTETRTVPNAANPVSMIMLDINHRGYCGGRGAAYGFNTAIFPPHDAEFDYWAGPRGNDCAVVDSNVPLCSTNEEPTTLVAKSARQCKGGTEVQFYKMMGGEHSWPNKPINRPGEPFYNPNFNETTGVTVNEILWNFFNAHPKKGSRLD